MCRNATQITLLGRFELGASDSNRHKGDDPAPFDFVNLFYTCSQILFRKPYQFCQLKTFLSFALV